MFDLNDVPTAGGTLNMSPVNPIGPFTEKFNDLATVINDPKQIGRVAAAQINPAFAAMGQGSFGYAGMDWEKILGSTVPGASYAMAVLSAKKRGAAKYTDRSSWWDYVRRRDALRIWPESVDPEKIREKGKEEAEKRDTRPSWEKAYEEDQDNVDKIIKAITKGKGADPNSKFLAPIKKSIAAYNALDQAEDAAADKYGVNTDDLTELQKLEATIRVAEEFYPETGPYPPIEKFEGLPDKSKGDVMSKQKYRQMLRDMIQEERSNFFSLGREMGVIESE